MATLKLWTKLNLTVNCHLDGQQLYTESDHEFSMPMSVSSSNEVVSDWSTQGTTITMSTTGNQSQASNISSFSQNLSNSQLSQISASSSSSKSRRLPNISSVGSTQNRCFICHDLQGRTRIPKSALAQVWTEKEIFIPHDNRCCSIHLERQLFSEEAMELIVPTKNGVLMSDEDLAQWILDLSKRNNLKSNSKRRRYNFDDPTDVDKEDYPNLVGFSKIQFNSLLTEISGHLHNSVNRTVRNALAIFLMLLRHNLSQVRYILLNTMQSLVNLYITAPL